MLDLGFWYPQLLSVQNHWFCQFSLVILEVWFCILDFGVWMSIWSKKQMRTKKPKKEETIHCLRGANPVVPQGEGPPRGNSRDFFFGVLGRDGKPNERHRKQWCNKTDSIVFQGPFHFFLGWFWRSDFVSWILGFGFGDLVKKTNGEGPFGTLAIFFLAFWN